MTESIKNKKPQIHLTLQGKGGVGKSMISSYIAQYMVSNNDDVIVVDTDPVNATLAGYKAFNTQRLELMVDGSLVERNFDKLMEEILEKDCNFIIDNGASSFIPLSYYIAENDAISLLTESGKQVIIHTVVTGGQALKDTLAGLVSLAEQIPGDAELIVWLNEYFGEIEADGKTFEQMNAYLKSRSRIKGIVKIARQTGSTFGEDVKMMLDRKMTFDEVKDSQEFGLMSKSRLTKIQKSIFEQLTMIL